MGPTGVDEPLLFEVELPLEELLPEESLDELPSDVVDEPLLDLVDDPNPPLAEAFFDVLSEVKVTATAVKDLPSVSPSHVVVASMGVE